jgi:hypothetical protein
MSQPESFQHVSPVDIVRHLWSRRYLFVFGIPLFFFGTYFYTLYFMKNVYESSATLMMRTTPAMLREGPRLEKIDPPAVVDLIRSDDILYTVVLAARARYPEFPQTNFDRSKGIFSIKTVITRDTTVQATYSPAVILQAKGTSPEIAQFLVTEWARLAVERYGQLRAREAAQIQDTVLERYAEFAEQAAGLASQQTELEIRREELDALHASRLLLLNGTSGSPLGDSTPAPIPGGLVGEAVRLQLELSNAESSASVRARLDKTGELIAQIRVELEELNAERAKVRSELEAVRRDLLLARERMGQLRAVATVATADATLIPDSSNPEIKGDLLLLSPPVKPEVHLEPRRTLLALGATIFLAAFLLLLLIFEIYIRRYAVERPAHQ